VRTRGCDCGRRAGAVRGPATRDPAICGDCAPRFAQFTAGYTRSARVRCGQHVLAGDKGELSLKTRRRVRLCRRDPRLSLSRPASAGSSVKRPHFGFCRGIRRDGRGAGGARLVGGESPVKDRGGGNADLRSAARRHRGVTRVAAGSIISAASPAPNEVPPRPPPSPPSPAREINETQVGRRGQASTGARARVWISYY